MWFGVMRKRRAVRVPPVQMDVTDKRELWCEESQENPCPAHCSPERGGLSPRVS